MNKRKILTLALSLCMVAILAIGGTLAYFTDTDYNENVMVTGSVYIDQREYERNEDGELVEFEDGHKLVPAVGDNNNDGMLDKYDDEENHLFAQDRNVVDKMISVLNTGKYDAYVRTIIAFEVPAEVPEGYNGATLKDVKGNDYVDVVNTAPYLYTVMNEGATAGKGYTLPKEGDAYVIIEKDGVSYLVTEYYYKNDSKLAPTEETAYSLKQIYMSAKATNDDAELMFGEDDEYSILALSQAVQTEGFENAKEALDTAFGAVNTANAQSWFDTYTNSKWHAKD